MAQMYFSKFNINSDIFDVYSNPELRYEILNKVMDSIDDEQFYTEIDKDASGNEKEIMYKFCNIIKNYDNNTITGRLVKIFEGELQTYDKENDTVITVNAEDCAVSSTFYFDVLHEEIAFITRVGLGYNQFNKHFATLINKYVDNYTFEMFLENNIGELKRKLYDMTKITSVDTVIIPPNADEEDYKDLFGVSYEEFKESGATKYKQALEVPKKQGMTVNIKAGFFNRILYGISKGYGELTAKGKNKHNESTTVTSSEDAPYKIGFPDSEKDSLTAFPERASGAVVSLLAYKQKHKIDSLNEEVGDEDGERK